MLKVEAPVPLSGTFVYSFRGNMHSPFPCVIPKNFLRELRFPPSNPSLRITYQAMRHPICPPNLVPIDSPALVFCPGRHIFCDSLSQS